MIVLGIDAGGTYTDAALIELREKGEVLAVAKALTTYEDLSIGIKNAINGIDFSYISQIEMICLSTTLATNAVVEGRGGKVCLLSLGGCPEGKLPYDEKIELNCSLDIRGNVVVDIDEDSIRSELQKIQGKYDAIVVSGYASIRNPSHEKKIARMARELLGLPVVCAHQLSNTLGYYQRTLTAILNGKLLHIVNNFFDSVDRVFKEMKLSVPVMVVRGDGSLMQKSMALERPIETILSGPAASVRGGVFLSGADECMVVDMGSTTTDISYVKDGRCKIAKDGAVVAGWHTLVQGIQLCTYGLGGDSNIIPLPEGGIEIGPQKIIPACRNDLRETTNITPTDLVHYTGEFTYWDTKRAKRAVNDFIEKNGGENVETLFNAVEDKLLNYIKETSEFFSLTKMPTVIGVGAPSKVWIDKTLRKANIDCVIPQYAEVANAIGAAAADFMETTCVLIRRDSLTGVFYTYSEDSRNEFDSIQEALDMARLEAQNVVIAKARKSGGNNIEVTVDEQKITDHRGFLIEYRVYANAIDKKDDGHLKITVKKK